DGDQRSDQCRILALRLEQHRGGSGAALQADATLRLAFRYGARAGPQTHLRGQSVASPIPLAGWTRGQRRASRQKQSAPARRRHHISNLPAAQGEFALGGTAMVPGHMAERAGLGLGPTASTLLPLPAS